MSVSYSAESFYFTASKITFDWTSNASGVAEYTTVKVGGLLVRVTFIPDSGGTQPSNNYNVTLLDDNDMDVLAGHGVGLSNTTTTHFQPGLPLKDGVTTSIGPIFISDILHLSVTGAGDSKGGKVVLYLR